MRYTSTRNTSLDFSFQEALTTGYAPDGGLFVPRKLPCIDSETLKSWKTLTYPSLMQNILRLFIDESEVSTEDLKMVCDKALEGFKNPLHAVPLVSLVDDNQLMIAELFHGPTHCFKDLGMRAVIQLLELFCERNQQNITLLVSTTGDTGPAAARAVADASNLKLAVHYPHEQISDFQRRQMTTLRSKNVQVVAFEGGGDDMDAPIKSLLQHQEENVIRTGVNSYNIVSTCSITFRNLTVVKMQGRPITQMAHYVWSYLRAEETHGWEIPDDLSQAVKLDIILPTGAMGNVTAAYMVQRMGLPLGRLYNSVNANDITHRVISSGDFGKSPNMVRTASEAINIQVPYNFERVLFYSTNENPSYVKSFYEQQPETSRALDPNAHATLSETFGSTSISDDEMKDAMLKTYQERGYLSDPHTAVALAGVRKLGLFERPIVLMATASPCKFQETVMGAVGQKAWDAYAATEPALQDSLEEVSPLFYPKVGETLEETQAHWESLLRDVLRKLETTNK